MLFSSGMAALCAVLEPALGAGDVLVACDDGYPGIRDVAADRLAPRGVEVRLVPTDTEAIVAACPGATLVWVETPANPALGVCDIAAVAAAAHAAGARLAVDNTLATPLGQRPLDLGADASMHSATKSLSGHSDLILGCVSVRDPAWAEALRAHRWQGGAIAGPFEAWLLHRSLPTLELRLARQSDNALALARFLRERPEVSGVCHPFLEDHPDHEVARRQMRHAGALVGFALDGAERAQRFLGALELVSEATSFGGVHASAERRGRWGTDAVPDGLHPLLRGLRGRRRPAGGRRAGARAELRGPPAGGPLESLDAQAPGGQGERCAALKVRPPCRGGVLRSGRSVRAPRAASSGTNLGGTLAWPWAIGSVRHPGGRFGVRLVHPALRAGRGARCRSRAARAPSGPPGAAPARLPRAPPRPPLRRAAS